MKKTLFFFLLLAMIAITPAKALLVTIPDANFRAYLQTTYPACFNMSGQMETTCAGITSATFLGVNNLNIANLSGVEYFTSLQALICFNNQLTVLPTLPASLQQLSCSNNQLTVLPTLPASLQFLSCFNNQLTVLPTLPASLKTLSCSNNQLTVLPTLPASLQDLRCTNNQLTVLPTLPASLQILYCDNNQLTVLPTLLASLQTLICYNNQLTVLPTLPASLQSLDCTNNQLTVLPTLPASLQNLDCDNNQLTVLPILPASLQNLRCNNNQLTVLPTLPASLQTLYCENNQLTVLPTLPASLTQLSCFANQLDFADLEAINPKPSFYSASPQSYKILPASRSLFVGGTLNINGGIGGSLNVYKWYKNNAPISGATSATFAIPSVTATNAGTYKCEVKSTFVGAGTTAGVTITSSDVVVTVLACPTITINPASLIGGTVGSTYSQTLTQTGLTGTAVWSVSAGILPAGLSIDSATGVISGTSTAAGTANITIIVGDGSGCTQTKVYSIAVVCPTVTVTPTPTTQSYVGGTAISSITLGASGVSGATYTYAVTSGALPAGVTLSAGVISGTPTTSVGGTFTITATSSIGACTGTAVYNYSVVCPTLVFGVPTATGATVGTLYNLNAGVTGNTQAVVYSVLPALPAGLNLNTGSGAISGTPTAPVASATYTVTATQGTCTATQAYTFAVACVGIVISPASLTGGTVGTAYSQTITQTGLTGTPAWSIIGTLPNGLTIASTTGIISGTPTTTAISAFAVSVTDGACSQTANYSVVIACPVITFTNTTASGAIVGIAYSLNAGVTGNTDVVVYSISPVLPAGLSLNTATGVISGAASAVTASATYTVTATQTVDCANTQSYTFGVIPACSPVVLGLASIPNATIGTPYSQTFTATGGTTGATYTFGTTSPQLALNGFSLSPAGVLSGTPTSSTSITFRVTATTTPNNCPGFKDYTIVINPNPATSVDNSLASSVKVSPNPSNGDFNVDFGTINTAKSSVRVYDMQGKVVFTSENNSNLRTISLDKFANGIYLLEVKTSNGRITKRLSKTN